MTLYILQPGSQPLGQFDFLDADLANVSGGDMGYWLEQAGRVNTATEKAAADVFDGYVADLVDAGTPDASRPLLRLADDSEGGNVAHFLLDDGTTGYGTLFGSLIGNPVGLSTTGTAIGPHTAQASGKVTAWDKPGLYAVSTDTLDDDVIDTTNLNDTPLPGGLLYRGAATAQLTRVATAGYQAALFIEMRGNGSLVNTPGSLVGATEGFDRIVIQFLGATHNIGHA